MFPASYQKTLRAHLTESQYLTLELLLLLLQVHRQVKLSTLASVFPQPIHYRSRLRHLQRFLCLPQLTVKVLWFPLLKHWIRQVQTGQGLNREQRRRLGRLKSSTCGYWLMVIDRTQWRERNLFVVSLVWGRHALPLYWQGLEQRGSSSLQTQKQLLKTVLPLFRSYPVLVLGDREFHSPKLAQWLTERGVSFVLRQKQSLHFQTASNQPYQVLKDLGLKPGMSQFYQPVRCNKGDALGPFNLAIYWKRKYRHRGPKAPWYLLTNLPTLKQALRLYRCRWGIEQFFKDCKSGGYHLEETRVNDERFLALVLLVAIAYSLATLFGQQLKTLGIDTYAGRIDQHNDSYPRQSDFSLGLYGQRWIHAMAVWHLWAARLMALKPHKSPFFRRGLHALALMQQAV